MWMKMLFGVMLLGALAGCTRGKIRIDVPDASVVEVGMSKVDVYELLGVPTEVFHGDRRKMFFYHQEILRGMHLELSVAAGVPPLVTWGDLDIGSDSLVIMFDEHDEVEFAQFAGYQQLATYGLWPF